jgi:hypothetical protein
MSLARMIAPGYGARPGGPRALPCDIWMLASITSIGQILMTSIG